MEYSSSWEANGHSVGQQIPRLLWYPKVHYRVHTGLYPEPHAYSNTPFHPTSLRSILILSSCLNLGLLSGLFPSGFQTK